MTQCSVFLTATSLVDAQFAVNMVLRASFISFQGPSLVSSAQGTSEGIDLSKFTIFNTNILSRDPYPPFYAQPNAIPFNLAITSSILQAWNLTNAKIVASKNGQTTLVEVTSTLMNCLVSVSSEHEPLLVADKTSLYIWIQESYSPAPPPGAAVTFSSNSPGAIIISPDSRLLFAPADLFDTSYYFIGGHITIEMGALGSCYWEANKLRISEESSIQTYCNLNLTGGLSGGGHQSMIAGITFGSPGTPPSLELGHANTYDGAFKLDTFWNLTFYMPPRYTTTEPLLPVMRPSSASSLTINGAPTGHTMIQWSYEGILPSINVLYPLYTISNEASREGIEPSPPLPPRNYDFEIVYMPVEIMSSTNVSASLLRLPPIPNSPESFGCTVQNGACTINGSITQPTLILPPNHQIFVINGNLTTSTITYSGFATIIVNGCLDPSLKNIEVQLSQEDIKKLEKAQKNKITVSLITVDSSGLNSCRNNDLSLIKVSASLKGSGCKRVKVSTSSTSKTVTAVFTLDTSKCNIWWIVLASVLGGLLLIGVLIVVLLVLFVPSFRHKIRPYSKKRRAQTS